MTVGDRDPDSSQINAETGRCREAVATVSTDGRQRVQIGYAVTIFAISIELINVWSHATGGSGAMFSRVMSSSRVPALKGLTRRKTRCGADEDGGSLH